jgi:hypothetical protein
MAKPALGDIGGATARDNERQAIDIRIARSDQPHGLRGGKDQDHGGGQRPPWRQGGGFERFIRTSALKIAILGEF